MIFITKAINKKLENQSLVELIDKRISGFEKARSHKVVHISDLSRDTGFCAREFALLDVTGKEARGQYISTALRVAFDNGSALHDLCRNKWLQNDVVGNWKCVYCKTVIEFAKKPKNDCHKCGARLWKYEEFFFANPENGASGSIDFFIDFESSKHVMVEAKSIDKDDFKELKAPLAEHRIRTQLYLLHLSRLKGPIANKIDLSRGIVLYISKGFGAKSDATGKVTPFKEFSVPRDDDSVKHLYGRADAVHLFRKQGKMPQGVCSNSFDKRAKMCPVAIECFSGKFPAGV